MLSALQEFFDDLVVIYASTVQSVKKFGESLLQVHVAFLYRTHARCVSETCGEGWKHNAFLTKKIQTQRRSVVMGADNKNKDNIMVYKKYSDIIWMTIIPAPGPKKKSATHMRKSTRSVTYTLPDEIQNTYVPNFYMIIYDIYHSIYR